MGYRSAVILGINPKSKKEFQKLDKGGYDNNPLFKHIKDIKGFAGDYPKLAIYESMFELKWYDSYEDVQTITDFIKSDKKNFIVAIGEDGEVHSEWGDYTDYLSIVTHYKLYEKGAYAKGGNVYDWEKFHGKYLANDMWVFLDSLKYNKHGKDKRITEKINKLSRMQYKAFTEFVKGRLDYLDKEYGDKVVRVSDDGWWDVRAEIVGRGSKFYGEKDLESIQQMIDDQDYAENFEYNFHDHPLFERGFEKGGKTDKRYELHIWKTQEHRDRGESFISTPQGKTEAEVIAEARNLYDDMDYPALEVIDTELEEDYGENVIFHISTDVPKGEKYAKGGKTNPFFVRPSFYGDGSDRTRNLREDSGTGADEREVYHYEGTNIRAKDILEAYKHFQKEILEKERARWERSIERDKELIKEAEEEYKDNIAKVKSVAKAQHWFDSEEEGFKVEEEVYVDYIDKNGKTAYTRFYANNPDEVVNRLKKLGAKGIIKMELEFEVDVNWERYNHISKIK